MKATAIAHPVQGLVKYHGLKDWKRRIPFHDSISVCMSTLSTITTVEVERELKEDFILINKKKVTQKEAKRVISVLNAIREVSGSSEKVRVVSENNIKRGKGLGFSSSGFAALGLAASTAFEVKVTQKEISEIVRLGAGSATRSLVGGFAIWYANKNGRSYAEQLATPKRIPLATIIIPITSKIKTEWAHRDAITSPFFKARLAYIPRVLERMKKAIEEGRLKEVCQIAEEDTLNLYAITMTGKRGLIPWEPETIKLIKEVVKMRRNGAPVWYSIDTGPSVFLNTYHNYAEQVAERIRNIVDKVLISEVGPEAHIIRRHLF